MSSKKCEWLEKQEGLGPKGEAVWAPRTGTRAELMEAIREDGPR